MRKRTFKSGFRVVGAQSNGRVEGEGFVQIIRFARSQAIINEWGGTASA